MLTAAEDRTARIWDVATGRELAVLRGHASLVSEASFSPDGVSILTSSMDGTARRWAYLRDQTLLDLACKLMVRPLTRRQREHFFLDREPASARCGRPPVEHVIVEEEWHRSYQPAFDIR